MSTATATVGKFVWHEQVSADPKQAQDFYTALFGWDTEAFKPGEIDYTMISSGGQVCRMTLSSVRITKGSELNVGQTTEMAGISCPQFGAPPGRRSGKRDLKGRDCV